MKIRMVMKVVTVVVMMLFGDMIFMSMITMLMNMIVTIVIVVTFFQHIGLGEFLHYLVFFSPIFSLILSARYLH